jgi:hypothetical protein
MTLNQALLNFGKRYIDEKNDWYNWRKINETNLPIGISLPKGNQYLKNIYLKKSLNEKWKKEGDLERKEVLIKYYIKDWGGIKKNSMQSMKEYQTLTPKELIDKGLKGIASWSKALVVHDCNNYAIFDARVSCSLNLLQIIESVPNKILFPVLASQNKKIISANKNLIILSKTQNWQLVDKSTFYNQYINLLKEVAIELNSDISSIEMLLFSKAEDLIDHAKLG